MQPPTLSIKFSVLILTKKPDENPKGELNPVMCTQRRSRTGTVSHRCLRPARLPIPPAGHYFFSGLQMYLNSLEFATNIFCGNKYLRSA